MEEPHAGYGRTRKISSPARGRGRERDGGRATGQDLAGTGEGLPPRPPDRGPGQALPRKRGRGKSGRNMTFPGGFMTKHDIS